jgi:hypothetical protein
VGLQLRAWDSAQAAAALGHLSPTAGAPWGGVLDYARLVGVLPHAPARGGGAAKDEL